MPNPHFDSQLKRILEEGFGDEFISFCATESSLIRDEAHPASRLYLPYLEGILSEMDLGNPFIDIKCEIPEEDIVPNGEEHGFIASKARYILAEESMNPSDPDDVSVIIGFLSYRMTDERKSPDIGFFMRTFVRAWIRYFCDSEVSD